jgi:hypothetical protein
MADETHIDLVIDTQYHLTQALIHKDIPKIIKYLKEINNISNSITNPNEEKN